MREVTIKDGCYWIADRKITNFTVEIIGTAIVKLCNDYGRERNVFFELEADTTKDTLNERMFLAAGNFKVIGDENDFSILWNYFKSMCS